MKQRVFGILAFLTIISFLFASAGTADLRAVQPVRADAGLVGQFSIVWGDGERGLGGSIERYFLLEDGGQIIELRLGGSLLAKPGDLLGLNRQRVRVSGEWLTPTGGDNSLKEFLIRSVELEPQSLPASPEDVSGPQPWVSVMCKFKDYAIEPKNLNYFLEMFASVFPGLDHYWREQSYDIANLTGSTAVGWYTLPRPRGDYITGGQLDWGLAAQDCTAVADAFVDYSGFVGINLMFNSDLDGYAWGGSWYLCLDGVCQSWRMTWEPPWGYENIGVIAHENGHGFGLPHSSGDYGQVYDNRWDVMSDVWGNGYDGGTHPIYGTMGQHTIAFHKAMLGWFTTEQVDVFNIGSRRTITLEQSALPQTANFRGAQVLIGGSSTHFYTVEARRRAGYDAYLPGDAVIIHEVDLNRGEPAHVVDSDGNGDTGDEGAMWRVGESFVDGDNDIKVTVNSATSSGFVVTIENQPVEIATVTINGPDQGIVHASYDFTASVLPLNASQPVTYIWEATEQTPITHTTGLTDVATFDWITQGNKTITVTVSNGGLLREDVFVINISSQPVMDVAISGPERGAIATELAFTAASMPITATWPITYVWQTAGQPPVTHTSGLTDTAIFEWGIPGSQVITVTASNAYGAVSSSHSLDLYTPLSEAAITGPAAGLIHAGQSFTASALPITATQPITYAWQATGQLPVTISGGVSNTIVFTWTLPGPQAITVTASSVGGEVVASHAFLANKKSPEQVVLAGLESGYVGESYVFTATILPITTTLPVTYVWQIDGQPAITVTGGLSDTLEVSWLDPGEHTITVSVSNGGAVVTQSRVIVIYTRVYLPVVRREP